MTARLQDYSIVIVEFGLAFFWLCLYCVDPVWTNLIAMTLWYIIACFAARQLVRLERHYRAKKISDPSFAAWR